MLEAWKRGSVQRLNPRMGAPSAGRTDGRCRRAIECASCASGATTAGADLDQDMLGKAREPNGAARLDWESAKKGAEGGQTRS